MLTGSSDGMASEGGSLPVSPDCLSVLLVSQACVRMPVLVAALVIVLGSAGALRGGGEECWGS